VITSPLHGPTTLNMICSVTNDSELHVPITSFVYVIIYQVNMFMFYNVQTTNSTFVVGLKMKCTVDNDGRCILPNSKWH
jgi:hypothetical protein